MTAATPQGVPAGQLSDELLRHELLQLKDKQSYVDDDGTADQKRNHARRTAELEAEFTARFGSGAGHDASSTDTDDAAGDTA